MWIRGPDLKADTADALLSKRQTGTKDRMLSRAFLLGFGDGEVNRERCVVRESLVAVNGLTSTGPG